MKKKQVMQGVGLVVLAGVVFALKHFGVISGDADEGSSVGPPTRQVETDQRAKATKQVGSSDRGGAVLAESERLEAAIDNKESGVILEAAGVVVKTLPDDNDGDRHQRFIVKLPSGRTVLVAHNIDLAPRVPLEELDIVEMKGQFEWNEQGGVLHWTHHDPGGWHEDGWIRHEGSIYQ